MSERLKGKVAVVTGASSGIGAGISRALAIASASVVVNYNSNKTGGKATAAAIRKAGGHAITVAGIAKQLAAEGASVVVNYFTSKEGADKVGGEIAAVGGNAIAIGAVDSITKVLAKELAPCKIRINAINPGLIHTEGAFAAGIPGSEAEKRIIAMIHLGRPGLPLDVALPAAFLASEDARYITSETLYVSGGAGI